MFGEGRGSEAGDVHSKAAHPSTLSPTGLFPIHSSSRLVKLQGQVPSIERQVQYGLEGLREVNRRCLPGEGGPGPGLEAS